MALAPIIPPNLEDKWDEISQLSQQIDESLRIIAILVKRLGGEVEIGKYELINSKTSAYSYIRDDAPIRVIKVVTSE